MFQGYLRFAGREVINVDRTMAYIKAGFGQPGVDFESPVEGYEGIASAVGDDPYQTPVADQAPWFDVARPETHGFAGVLPLGITGMGGSTRSVSTAERIGNGGVALAQRHASRTMAVSALLVGTSTESLHAGLEWLTTVLHRTCEDGASAVGCGGAPLEAFTVNPGPVGPVEDYEAALVVHDVPVTASWRVYDGLFDSTTGLLDPSPFDPVDLIDGGAPEPEPSAGFNDARPPLSSDQPPPSETLDGGTPLDPFTSIPSPRSRLTADHTLTCLSQVVVTWTLSPGGGAPPSVRVGAADQLGRLYEVSAPVVVDTADQVVVYDRQFPSWDSWRPVLITTEDVIVEGLTVAYRPDADPETCVTPYRRTFADVTCVAAPSVVEEIAVDDCGTEMWKVEWTWVAGDAFRYGDPTQLAAGVPVAGGEPLELAVGVQATYEAAVSAAATECTAPVRPPSCALDPARPGRVAPPAAPLIGDLGRPVVPSYRRSVLALNPEVLPDHVTNALVFRFTNDGTAKRGVRVRLFQHDDPDFSLHDECDFSTEFWIDYIDPGATLVVDTVAGQVVAVCDDGSLSPAGGVMRGPYRSAFVAPTITCGGRWFVAVDVPDATGLLTYSVSSAIREG